MSQHSQFGRKLIASMKQMVDGLESGDTQLLTIRHVELPPAPSVYSAARVRATRRQLHVSQKIFAHLLGVSTVLAQAWEHGTRTPSPMARRLLDEINEDPDRWRRKLRAT